MQQYLNIGEVINSHGVRGDVKVYPLTDDISRFEKLKTVFLGDELKVYKILGVKLLKNTVVLKLEGIETVEAAQSLKGKLLKVDRKNAVKLSTDEYFVCDLIGCAVRDLEKSLDGVLTNIIETGSNDVYVVKDKTGKEVLIPAIKSIIKEISIENKTILVELPEGLIDL